MGAEIRAEGAPKRAREGAREADRAEAKARLCGRAERVYGAAVDVSTLDHGFRWRRFTTIRRKLNVGPSINDDFNG
jgi:hypothetical protein